MVGKGFPLFNEGNKSTDEMLDALQNYTISSREVDYTGYSDGILKGCKLTITDEYITISKGVLIFQETAYYVTEPFSLSYKPTNQWVILKGSLLDEVETEDFISRDMDISLVGEDQIGDHDIEICRFRLQPGARLRKRFINFDDLYSEYDTVCEIHSNWAAHGESSVSYTILQSFFREALKHPMTDVENMQFC